MTDHSSRISRRTVIQAGAAAGLYASMPGLARAATAGLTCNGMACAKIPGTEEALPVIGVGTNRFGSVGVAGAKDVLAKMHEMGGRIIDTAAMYGDSEAVIGQALKELDLQDEMFVVTKFNSAGVGSRGGQNEVAGLASFERSLERLQTNSVDLLFAHFLGSVEPLMPVMLDLKEKGLVRYIGITSVNRSEHPAIMEYMREYPIDWLQIDYSLGNRDTALDVLPLAEERGIAVMVAVPFGGRRNSLFADIGGRAIPEWAAEFGAETWGQFFLKYVVSHPAVTCAIPGTTDVEHMEDNQGAAFGTLPDEAMRRRMEAFWDGTA